MMDDTSRALVRITFWQTLLSLIGIFVAVVALYAALTESGEMRRQTAAAVWPYIQLSIEDYSTPDAALFSISLTNVGVGPAKLQSMRVLFDGSPAQDWAGLIQALTDGEDIIFSQDYSRNRVFSPGERVSLFATNDLDLVKLLQQKVAQGSGSIDYCYCSIFEQCWLASSTNSDGEARPLVEACPDFGVEAFQH